MKMQSSTPVSSSLAHMLLQLKDGSQQQQQQEKLSSNHEKEMKSVSNQCISFYILNSNTIL